MPYFTDESKIIEDYSIEEMKEMFDEINSSKNKVTYTHPLKQTFGPSKCDIAETHTHYFISPTKFIVRNFVENFGFTFWDCFNPMYTHIIEQKYDKKKNKFSVSIKYYFRVNFVKSVMFFQSKIKTEAQKETKSTINEILCPMIREYLSEFSERFIRPIPKSKKKMTKVAKLQLEIEDLQTENEENMNKLKKDYESQISSLNQELTESKEENEALEFKFKIVSGVLAALIFLIVIRFLYSLFF